MNERHSPQAKSAHFNRRGVHQRVKYIEGHLTEAQESVVQQSYAHWAGEKVSQRGDLLLGCRAEGRRWTGILRKQRLRFSALHMFLLTGNRGG
jgi:hypothetical protein